MKSTLKHTIVTLRGERNRLTKEITRHQEKVKDYDDVIVRLERLNGVSIGPRQRSRRRAKAAPVTKEVKYASALAEITAKAQQHLPGTFTARELAETLHIDKKKAENFITQWRAKGWVVNSTDGIKPARYQRTKAYGKS